MNLSAAAKNLEETITAQLDRQKRAVSYDMYDMTVRQLVDTVEGGEIEIAPEYQRHFVWDADRESELIERYIWVSQFQVSTWPQIKTEHGKSLMESRD